MRMSSILIAQDYNGQQAALAAELEKEGFEVSCCRCVIDELAVKLVQLRPDFMFVNLTRLGSADAQQLLLLKARLPECKMINTYTYESPLFLYKLESRGVVNIPMPVDCKAAVDYVKSVCSQPQQDSSSELEMLRKRITVLLGELSPDTERGNKCIADAVWILLSHGKTRPDNDVYREVARINSMTVSSAEHNIRRSVKACVAADKEKLSELLSLGSFSKLTVPGFITALCACAACGNITAIGE